VGNEINYLEVTMENKGGCKVQKGRTIATSRNI
jgi:hypothetical protein